MLRWLKRYAIMVLVAYLVRLAALPLTRAELEIRKDLRAGDLLINGETILAPFQITLLHRQTLAETDAEAFAMSPLSPAGNGGFSIAQTNDGAVAATRTGFFNGIFPNFRIVDFPTEPIGQGLAWAQDVQPMRISGLPRNTAMIFPAMTEISRMDNEKGLGNNSSYTFNNNFSKPYYPGNMMMVRNITNDKGENQTVIDPVPRDYMTIIAPPDQVANKTIIERMWRDVHLNYNLDRAYSGETCSPDLIYPVKNPFARVFLIPLNRSNDDALILKRPGKHIKRLFWPV